MTTVLVFGGSSQMVALYGGIILLILLIIGISKTISGIKAYRARKRHEREVAREQELFDGTELYLGIQ